MDKSILRFNSTKFALRLALLTVAVGFSVKAAADDNVPPLNEVVESFTQPNANCDKALAVFGHQGCLIIQSQHRLEFITAKLKELGWTAPPSWKSDVDYSKNVVVYFYRYGDVQDQLSVHGFAPDAHQDKLLAKLDLSMEYFRYSGRSREGHRFSFVLVTLPITSQSPLEVDFSTCANANNNGDQAPPPKTELEWKGVFDLDHGDVADNLQAVISAKHNTIKPGDDILLSFQLQWADDAIDNSAHMAAPDDVAYVWDGKFSNGYRNHHFEVTTPDGKTQELWPKEIDSWRANPMDLIKITATQPYNLLDPIGGKEKSLKAMGLDTSTPGKYIIRGFYSEERNDKRKPGPWGGTIGSNTIAVEVTAAAP